MPFFFTATGFFLLGELVRPGLRPRTLSPGVRRFLKKTGVLYAACTVLYLPVTLYAGNFPVENVLGELVRDAVLDGTFYHLWYLPAALLGVLVVCGLLRFLRPGAAAGVCGALYLAGLLGDSWYGLAKQLPALKEGYDALFGVMDYTRNGLFFAPAFLMLGALLAGFPARRRPRACLAGLGCSLALLFAEAFGLRALGWPRHDSMYLALVPCACFLFLCLLVPRGGDAPFLREFSMLVYVLHPMAIVGVRGAARVLHAREWLVENSLAHFAAVAAASCAAAWLLARLSQRRRWDGRSGTAPKPDLRRARAWAEVDLEAVARNAGALQGCMPAGCRLMAVVKADAYGHGAPAVAGRLWQAGVRAFAVATPEEGAQLRRCGITGEILVLGYADAARIRELRRWRLCQTVTDPAHARALARAAGRRPLPVHIAVDTGMHRLGTDAGAAPAVAEMLRLPGLEVRGLFTHLAVADSPAPEDAAFTRTQLDAFEALARKLRGAGYTLPPLHAQASCGILNQPQPDCGYARPGIALYGALSTAGCAARLHPVLAPALALRARVVSVRRVPRGLWPCGPGTALHPAGGSGHRLRGRLAARGGRRARPCAAARQARARCGPGVYGPASGGCNGHRRGGGGCGNAHRRGRPGAHHRRGSGRGGGHHRQRAFVPHRSPRAPRLSALRKRKPRGVVHTTQRGCFLLHNKSLSGRSAWPEK